MQKVFINQGKTDYVSQFFWNPTQTKRKKTFFANINPSLRCIFLYFFHVRLLNEKIEKSNTKIQIKKEHAYIVELISKILLLLRFEIQPSLENQIPTICLNDIHNPIQRYL
ncbi:unnamed protein product (macronuclear) [Paramecium tetraurelia]|uniref:Uncharacterized protein n=1 Tax=Paramecium tetraurelia TaxID=5888 RepID=A0CZF9_PARTE|nr:uncharacterized protein GSPATT00011749001 [Paramecium tetraurelia]CAK76176.1 unnamed protein product [Paramecium tetraurelia]|eukprot:XP_001443573.1 hypothetical protein (macronuclear) [Paramecium tetraurelia strain d4-2]